MFRESQEPVSDKERERLREEFYRELQVIYRKQELIEFLEDWFEAATELIHEYGQDLPKEDKIAKEEIKSIIKKHFKK